MNRTDGKRRQSQAAPLGQQMGPQDRDTMATDGFHPGAPVYRAVAEALADHIACHVMPRLRLDAN